MVGPAGLEPATFRPPDGRATRLRYSPTMDGLYCFWGRWQALNQKLDARLQLFGIRKNILQPVAQFGQGFFLARP